MEFKKEKDVTKHSYYDDIMAMFLGTGLVSLGLVFYAHATLSTGGTAGMAFLIYYVADIDFGLIFFAVNVPFFIFGFLKMGVKFTVKSFIAVSIVALFTTVFPQWLVLENINPLFAVIVGGALMGMGVLSLYRHRTSLGGINMLALYVQDRFGWRAGYFQLFIDVVVLSGALFVLDLDKVLLSMLGVLVLNLVVALNHRSGRYMGVS